MLSRRLISKYEKNIKRQVPVIESNFISQHLNKNSPLNRKRNLYLDIVETNGNLISIFIN